MIFHDGNSSRINIKMEQNNNFEIHLKIHFKTIISKLISFIIIIHDNNNRNHLYLMESRIFKLVIMILMMGKTNLASYKKRKY